MKPDALVAGRFELIPSRKWQPTFGIERETGRRVRVVSIPSHYFLDRAAIEHQATLVTALGDPTLVAPLHTDPLVFPAPSDEPELDPAAWVDAAIELVDTVGRAWRAGLCVNPKAAWIDADGVLRQPAPSALPGLHVELTGRKREWLLMAIARWLEQRVEGAREWAQETGEPLSFARMLAERASDPQAAREKVEAFEPWPRRLDVALDFDRGIALGEAALRNGLPRFEAQYANMPLAAAYHHRACVRWREGNLHAARKDVARACELDPHVRYLTTAALLTDGGPGPLHNKAVAALQAEPDIYNVEPELRSDDNRVADQDAARTLHARAVHRSKTGDPAGAIADLELSLAHHPTPGARALLDRLNRAPEL